MKTPYLTTTQVTLNQLLDRPNLNHTVPVLLTPNRKLDSAQLSVKRNTGREIWKKRPLEELLSHRNLDSAMSQLLKTFKTDF